MTENKKMKRLTVNQRILTGLGDSQVFVPINMVTVKIDGEIDRKKLEKTINDLIRDNDAFSYKFHFNKDDKELYQYLDDGVVYKLDERICEGSTYEEKYDYVRRGVHELRNSMSLNIGNDIVPWAFVLFNLGGEEHIFCMMICHLIADGAANEIISQQIINRYNDRPVKNGPGMSELIKEQDEYYESEEYKNLLEKKAEEIKRTLEYKPFLVIKPNGTGEAYTEKLFDIEKKDIEEFCQKKRLGYFHLMMYLLHLTLTVFYEKNETRVYTNVMNRNNKYMNTVGHAFGSFFSTFELDKEKKLSDSAIDCRNKYLRGRELVPVYSEIVAEKKYAIECGLSYANFLSNYDKMIDFGKAKACVLDDPTFRDEGVANMMVIFGIETDDAILLNLFTNDYILSLEETEKFGNIIRKGLEYLIEDKTVGEFIDECKKID